MFFADELNFNNHREIEEIRNFLNKFQIQYGNPDKTFIIRDKGNIIATGSAEGNILKYFFAKEEYQGQGIMPIIYQALVNYILNKGYDSYFVFTTPNNKMIFNSLGLSQVYSTDKVSLFEGGFYNYNKWINKLKKDIGLKENKRGAIVLNCNPLTLGHKYLIEKALGEVEELLLFIVEEDSSIFPFNARYNIVKEEFKDEEKIVVLEGGPYIISRGTFPTYFIKRKDEMLDIYTELDGKIFADKIGKDLELDIRFFGSEPKDEVTSRYNENLKEILESKEIETRIIPRKELEGKTISASYVRKLLANGEISSAYKFLPESTIKFLESEEGKEIIKLLKINYSI